MLLSKYYAELARGVHFVSEWFQRRSRRYCCRRFPWIYETAVRAVCGGKKTFALLPNVCELRKYVGGRAFRLASALA